MLSFTALWLIFLLPRYILPSPPTTSDPKPATMSAGPSTPSATAPNIARYTNAISSNLGNLMSEIGRASAPSGDAILNQLQIITEQLTLVIRRLNALEQVSSPQTDGVVPLELSPNKLTLPTAAYVVCRLPCSCACSRDACTVRTMPARGCTTRRRGSVAMRCSRCTMRTIE